MCITEHYSIRQETIPENNRGVFRSFLYRYIQLIAEFECAPRKLKRHCRYMHTELKGMGYKETNSLAKLYKELSEGYGEDIADEAKSYLKEVDRVAPHRTEFFNAMEEIFRLQEHVRFDDYIRDFEDYCNDHKLFIEDETHSLLYDVILSTIKKKLGRRELKKLKRKLNAAVKEYEKIEVAEYAKMYSFPTLATKDGRLVLPHAASWAI